MNIQEYISQYRNHPILFVGTGMSLRYLHNSFTWDGLLRNIAYELTENKEYYLDIKAKCKIDSKYDYTLMASRIEKDFNEHLEKNRNGKFQEINDVFYSEMEKDNPLSRFKIYVTKLVEKLEYKEDKKEELLQLKKIRKNVGSVITTNYDRLIEDIFEFSPLIGNNILLSNPYGSVYKIHGCQSDPAKIIITEEDYSYFHGKYELIRAQLLSMFIHNPIIFIGYNIGDENIKSLLKTIFTYVEPNSETAKTIRNNFLLVEYAENSRSHEITEHDIDLEGFSSTIRINKVKTDDFKELYSRLSDLALPVSAMDVRKVQDIVKDIYSGAKEDGSSIKVNITEDIDSLENRDKILVIGSNNSIKYEHRNATSFIIDYFSIIEEENYRLINIIDKIKIASTQWFPIYGYDSINNTLSTSGVLKTQQLNKISEYIERIGPANKTDHTTILDIDNDESITMTRKTDAIIWSIWNNSISLDDVENYLKKNHDKKSTSVRKLLCVYDYKKYYIPQS